MNKAMSCHSSTILGQALYVYGGNATREIERLDISYKQGTASAWETVRIEGDLVVHYQRDWPILCAVNETTLLVSGSCLRKFGELSDRFVLYDTVTGETTSKESMKILHQFYAQSYKVPGKP